MSDRVIRGYALPDWPHWAPNLHALARTVATRQALLDLDEHLLNDIGLDRAGALAEAGRLPWDIAPPRPRSGPDRPGHIRTVWSWLRTAYRRYRSRQQIASLDATLLKDIGVSYAEAEAEANKPFWRP